MRDFRLQPELSSAVFRHPKKMAKRLQVRTKVSNAVWGIGFRISAVTPHALLDCAMRYGLAATGTHSNARESRRIHTTILNRAAERIAGANITMRRETLPMMAGKRSTVNHCTVNSADVLDRALRARGAAATGGTTSEARRQLSDRAVCSPAENTLK